jgi:hypothetical protein
LPLESNAASSGAPSPGYSQHAIGACIHRHIKTSKVQLQVLQKRDLRTKRPQLALRKVKWGEPESASKGAVFVERVKTLLTWGK